MCLYQVKVLVNKLKQNEFIWGRVRDTLHLDLNSYSYFALISQGK